MRFVTTSIRPDSRLLRLDLAWVGAAILAIAYIFFDHACKASLNIDGVRYFWLDDDQMISMRYARNLAEGHGLVWNVGERVEGYTNFGWTLLMALVHLLPIPDAKTSLFVRFLAFCACAGSAYYAARIWRHFDTDSYSLGLPVALVCIATCTDVMFWAAAGFETPLVTLLHLMVVFGALSSATSSWKTLLPLALIPIVRSDGLHIWAGDAALLLFLAQDRRRQLFVLGLTLFPFFAHLGFRRVYYGDWLPNTYYLKVSGLDRRILRGSSYVRTYLERYWLPWIFAVGSAASLIRQDKRTIYILTSALPPILYSFSVGGDAFVPFRFFAHIMPELFILAAVGATQCVRTLPAQCAWLAAMGVFAVPGRRPLTTIASVSPNGDPFEQIVVATLLRKNADPISSVAVIPAGIVPYFSRLHALDLLGKTDKHVARLVPRANALIGHGKFDPAYSFDKHPDYFVSCRPTESARPDMSVQEKEYVRAFLEAPEFRARYARNPIPDPFLMARTAVYVADRSKELTKLRTWQGVRLQP
jgi:hypothetical protein